MNKSLKHFSDPSLLFDWRVVLLGLLIAFSAIWINVQFLLREKDKVRIEESMKRPSVEMND